MWSFGILDAYGGGLSVAYYGLSMTLLADRPGLGAKGDELSSVVGLLIANANHIYGMYERTNETAKKPIISAVVFATPSSGTTHMGEFSESGVRMCKELNALSSDKQGEYLADWAHRL